MDPLSGACIPIKLNREVNISKFWIKIWQGFCLKYDKDFEKDFAIRFFFPGFESTQLARQLHQEVTQFEVSLEGARVEDTPAVHVTGLYVSWYVRVVETQSILN